MALYRIVSACHKDRTDRPEAAASPDGHHSIPIMRFIAEIDIMPHKELLDPQGKTVAHSMQQLEIGGVEDVRIGKHVTLTLEAATEAEAGAMVETACRKLLANLIMESYSYQLVTATD